jgi:hypothetical protein
MFVEKEVVPGFGLKNKPSVKEALQHQPPMIYVILWIPI